MSNINRAVAVLAALIAGASFQAVAINLGGTNVPKDHFIVYLGIGHSNFAGRNVTQADGQVSPYCWNYRWCPRYSSFPNTPWGNTWEPAIEHNGGDPVGYPDGYDGLTSRGTGGPSMPFLKKMAAAHPGYYIGIIENAISKAGLRYLTYATDPDDENTYWKQSNGVRYQEIITFAKAIQAEATLGGVLCMFGAFEVNQNMQSALNTFAADFKTMVATMRADLGMPNLPFLSGNYEDGATGAYSTQSAAGKIAVAQLKLVADVPHFIDTISSVGCAMLDEHHYNTSGQNTWTARVVATIDKHGWFPAPITANLMPRAFAQKPETPVAIYSVTGKRIGSYTAALGPAPINFSSVPHGVYLLGSGSNCKRAVNPVRQ